MGSNHTAVCLEEYWGREEGKKKKQKVCHKIVFPSNYRSASFLIFQHYDHLNKNLIIISIDTVMKIRGSLGPLPIDKELRQVMTEETEKIDYHRAISSLIGHPIKSDQS